MNISSITSALVYTHNTHADTPYNAKQWSIQIAIQLLNMWQEVFEE